MRSALLLVALTTGQLSAQESPEATFKSMAKLKQDGKWDVMPTIMTSAGKQKTLHDYVVSAIFAFDKSSYPDHAILLAKQFKKFGITDQIPNEFSRQKVDSACAAICKLVVMREFEFISEMDSILKTHPEKFHAREFFEGTLTNIKTSGKIATAEVRYYKNSSVKIIQFKFERGKWLFDGAVNQINLRKVD